uniref:Protein FAR1-RELATED SEQUENCE n=1 Tax=Aegilops tauschii TaxID=37682 RepID=M8B1T9_AEGTA
MGHKAHPRCAPPLSPLAATQMGSGAAATPGEGTLGGGAAPPLPLYILETTARSEGFNDVLEKYVNPNNSLIEFATQYTAIQEKVMVAVAKEQVDTIYKEANMYSLNPIELQMRGIYTQNLFSKFQVEMKLKTAYGCDTLQDGTFRMWSLRGILPKYGDRDYHVQANKDEGVYACTCCKCDRDGLLCAHILRVLE